MESKYQNMYEMFKSSKRAKSYFDSLPGYVQEQISSRSDSVNSYSGLRDYAENLLRGDD